MSDPFDLSNLVDASPHDASQGAPVAGPPYLTALNEAQQEAVEAVDGPVLVLAGAGTGKTRVLTTRLAHILATGRARPGQVLAVTFTNKAAREMKDRVAALLERPVEGMWIGTFHAMAARILRRHAELVGLSPTFTILDTDDQLRLLKQLIAAENIDEKRWPARVLGGLIDRWKNRAIAPDQLPETEAHAFADGLGGRLYRDYQARLKTLNACDFGDLLLHCIRLFQTEPDVLADYHRRFQYLLVDEYQDTNVAQYLWLRLLAQAGHNICCVGDDDQSIYGWRGAEVGNILRFEEDFPGAKIVRLERNYRSTQNILTAASGLIAANKGRLGKTLWTDIGEGDPVKVQGVWDGPEEARVVGDEVEALQSKKISLADMAVLVRAGFQTREFEERFITLGVPYRVIGGPRFYERAEIRDAMAYLRVVAQPADDLAFERIVNVPARGIGNVTLQKVHQLARAEHIPMTAAAQAMVESDEIRGKARSSLKQLLDDFDRWREQAAVSSHTALAEAVLEESGYVAKWQNARTPDAPGRLENLAELVRAMAGFENLAGFLEHIALVMENEENDSEEKLSIMTLHAAKGLEFDHVFLPGWEDGIFPNQRSLDEGGQASLEEERRLAYVGLTRAKLRAHILFASNRQMFGQWQSAIPSRFLDELPEGALERVSAQGVYGSGSAYGSSAQYDSWDNEKISQRHGPGWRRARQRGMGQPGFGRKGFGEAGQTKFIDAEPSKVVIRAHAVSDFAVGERVFHDKFGYGQVEDVDGNKLQVNFEKAGTKKVLDSFVKRP